MIVYLSHDRDAALVLPVLAMGFENGSEALSVGAASSGIRGLT